MGSFDLALVVGVCLFGFIWIYSIARVTWRLWRGDVESAGRDGDTWRLWRRNRRRGG